MDTGRSFYFVPPVFIYFIKHTNPSRTDTLSVWTRLGLKVLLLPSEVQMQLGSAQTAGEELSLLFLPLKPL